MKDKIKEKSEQWKEDMEELSFIESLMEGYMEGSEDSVLQALFSRWKAQRVKCNKGYLEYMDLLGELVENPVKGNGVR